MSEGIVTEVQTTIFKFLVLNSPSLSVKSYLIFILQQLLQECKTIRDVECRIVNIDKHGKYFPKVS